jgi:hypothetical protein
MFSASAPHGVLYLQLLVPRPLFGSSRPGRAYASANGAARPPPRMHAAVTFSLELQTHRQLAHWPLAGRWRRVLGAKKKRLSLEATPTACPDTRPRCRQTSSCIILPEAAFPVGFWSPMVWEPGRQPS